MARYRITEDERKNNGFIVTLIADQRYILCLFEVSVNNGKASTSIYPSSAEKTLLHTR